jgi:hypothetical protein
LQPGIMSEHSTGQPQNSDSSVVYAQLDLFIRLGNMDDLDPNRHFAAMLNLGNALIEGRLPEIRQALAFYANRADLLIEHIGYLNRAFAHTGVTILEPAVSKYAALGGQKTAVSISVLLERAGKATFVSSDPAIKSYVHVTEWTEHGTITTEDPRLLLKQLSRVIRLPEETAPPPFSSAASLRAAKLG